MTRLRTLIAGAVAAALLAAAPAVARQGGAENDVAIRLIEALQSPFCPGLNLAACPSAQAAELRDEIRARLAGGESVAELRTDLVRRFGQEILGYPGWSGWGLVAWITPGALVAIASAFLAWRIRKGSANPRADASPTTPALGPKEQERLQAALDELN